MPGGKALGHMKPVGGGDPIPLSKNEIVIGRRPSCDVRLDFENVSGRHCMLTFTNGTWHIRDLGSTNGTKVNGSKLSREQGVMPDDEVAIATHLFTIDYEPAAPLMESQQVLEEETLQARERTSLMELAGLDREDRPRPAARREESHAMRSEVGRAEGDRKTEFEAAPDEDRLEGPAEGVLDHLPDEDEFLKMIEEDLGPDPK